MNSTIYIALLDKGTQVWRPLSADRVDEDVYRIVGPRQMTARPGSSCPVTRSAANIMFLPAEMKDW